MRAVSQPSHRRRDCNASARRQTANNALLRAALIGIIVVANAACAIAFLFTGCVASIIELQETSLSQLLGEALAALAVQFVINGSQVAFGWADSWLPGSCRA
jgi:small neutral amino acid transporter SnatA (MarC family)